MSKSNELLDKFRKVNTTELPDFYIYNITLDKVLWVLWIAKEKCNIKKLNADQISEIIVNNFEVSVNNQSIINSLKRATQSVHVSRENGTTFYEIMKHGKDRLLLIVNRTAINTFYFQPDHSFSSKKILANEILAKMSGEIKILDPYCNERTLDILSDCKNKKIKFLTRLSHLKGIKLTKFLRELGDLQIENKLLQVKEYIGNDIHDRYIISKDELVLLGHSIKDLGKKESFAVVLKAHDFNNIYQAVTENFNRRWKICPTV